MACTSGVGTLDRYTLSTPNFSLIPVAVRTLARQIPAPLVSVHEAAERLGVSVNTVRRRVKSGEIPCTRIGKVLRIDLSKVRVLDQGEVDEMAQRAMAR